jgi:hypothetical protein
VSDLPRPLMTGRQGTWVVRSADNGVLGLVSKEMFCFCPLSIVYYFLGSSSPGLYTLFNALRNTEGNCLLKFRLIESSHCSGSSEVIQKKDFSQKVAIFGVRGQVLHVRSNIVTLCF